MKGNICRFGKHHFFSWILSFCCTFATVTYAVNLYAQDLRYDSLSEEVKGLFVKQFIENEPRLMFIFDRLEGTGVVSITIFKREEDLFRQVGDVARIIIWNRAARAVYRRGSPKDAGRWEFGAASRAAVGIDGLLQRKGFGRYSDDALIEFWRDFGAESIHLPISEKSN